MKKQFVEERRLTRQNEKKNKNREKINLELPAMRQRASSDSKSSRVRSPSAESARERSSSVCDDLYAFSTQSMSSSWDGHSRSTSPSGSEPRTPDSSRSLSPRLSPEPRTLMTAVAEESPENPAPSTSVDIVSAEELCSPKSLIFPFRGRNGQNGLIYPQTFCSKRQAPSTEHSVAQVRHIVKLYTSASHRGSPNQTIHCSMFNVISLAGYRRNTFGQTLF